MVLNGREVILRQSAPGQSTNLIAGAGNGVGNRIVVPGGPSLIFLDAATGEERGRRGLQEFGAQPGAATVLVMGRRLLYSQPDRLIALDEAPDEVLARN